MFCPTQVDMQPLKDEFNKLKSSEIRVPVNKRRTITPAFESLDGYSFPEVKKAKSVISVSNIIHDIWYIANVCMLSISALH